MSKSLFSFGAMRPGAKISPFDYGAKLVSYRLAQEQLKNADFFEYTPPKSLVSIPPIDAKWKIAPEFSISEKLPVENARNILIATTWRSGSSFLGDLLNHYPGTYYTFEPIHYLDKKFGRQWAPQDALNLIRDIYHCDFATNYTTGFLKHTSAHENQFIMKHNGRIWKSCASLLPSSVACFMPEYFKLVCPLFPIRLIKTVRLRVQSIETLLKEADLSLKVVVLGKKKYHEM